MIRHAGRAAALFAVGALFASGAWAQMAQTVTDKYLVAEELFGSADGTVVKLGSSGAATGAARPAVRLAVPDGGIASDNTAEISFELTGAVFGQNVGSATLDLRATAASTDAAQGLSAEVISGGATGDGSVTFLVEATQGLTAGQLISFWVPDLSVTPVTFGTGDAAVKGVAITASSVEKRAVKNGAQGPFPKVAGTGEMGALMIAERLVLETADVVGIDMGMGGMAEVALDNRMVFADSGATHTPQGAEAPIKALRVGTLTVTISGDTNGEATTGGEVYTLDPTKQAVNPGTDTATAEDNVLDGSLAGNVDVVVSGAFKTGDMVVYGTPAKAAKIEGGMAAVSVPIALGSSPMTFLYVPGGVDSLRPGAINAVAMLNFSATGNAPGKAAMSMGTIDYQGVSVQAYAHGVVRGGGMDSSYVRVRCANATACTIFADCHDEMGMNHFNEAGMVPPGATAVVNSDMIAAALGGGWSSGKGACDILSNGSLEVQHMVRSGHTLVNNSAVVGRSLSENRLMSIDEALANICGSLPGHLGREGNDGNATPDDLTDDISKIAETMCNNALAGGAVIEDTVDANGDAPGL